MDKPSIPWSEVRNRLLKNTKTAELMKNLNLNMK